MGQTRYSAWARSIGGAAVLIASIAFLSPASGAEKPCPSAVQSLQRGAPLRELAESVAAREPVRIVAIGSSSTEGVGASSKSAAYPAQLEGQLRAAWRLGNVEVENAGIGGETADQTIARLEASLAKKPDLVIWQVGTNDAVRGGDETAFQAVVERGVRAARQAGVDLVLLDQQFYPGIKDLDRYQRFVRIVAQVGREYRVSVFSRFALMKGWASEGAAEIESMLAPDGFHMSDRGYDCLTRSLTRGIASLAPVSPAVAAAQ
jgi:lysophospholipase L1-like esterase